MFMSIEINKISPCQFHCEISKLVQSIGDLDLNGPSLSVWLMAVSYKPDNDYSAIACFFAKTETDTLTCATRFFINSEHHLIWPIKSYKVVKKSQ